MLKRYHQIELLNSAIDNKLADLNFRSVEGEEVIGLIWYAVSRQKLRRNDGRLKDKYLKVYYENFQQGGWYCCGLDPHNNWEPMEWGRFKPDSPRLEHNTSTDKQKTKFVKYESPRKPAQNRVTYFRVTPEIWQKVAQRYEVPMPEEIIISADGEAIGFWAWVCSHPEIPLILTEGEKKAACLLSMGFVPIALPGIWCGTRKLIEEFHQLHPDLVPMANGGRKFIVLFDYETKRKTINAIYQATMRLGKAISSHKCPVKVALLSGPQKGIDDWVVAQGDGADEAVSSLIAEAISIDYYPGWFFGRTKRGLLKYKPDIRLNVRFLSEAFQLPEKGFVILASDMGTGKTELMKQWRENHPDERFLNNSHRVNLLKNLAARLETEMYNMVNSGELKNVDHLSITVDSLYKLGSNLETYGCVFIDEACQYLAHLLRSKTCKKYRAEILDTLEYVVYQTPLFVVADAHMDDICIDFFLNMRPEGEKPLIVQNDWKSGGRDVYWYEGRDSSALVAAIHAAVVDGKKIIIFSDSKRFILKIEKSLINAHYRVDGDDLSDEEEEEEEDNPLPRMWFIHSGNSGSEENVVFIREINDAIRLIDILGCSPSLGSGIDISRYHFDLIFGAFHAVSQSATECIQQLWRYRQNVPMHVWVAPRPPYGYAECSAQKIKQQILDKNEMTAFLIRTDRETGKRGAEKDWALEAHCQIEAKRNWSTNNLRGDLRSVLEQMENNMIPMGGATDESAYQRMKEAAKALDQEHYQKVANSADIDHRVYEARQHEDYLSPEQYLECEKFRIANSYGMEVTPELVEKDDGGKFIGKLASLEALLAPSSETITDSQGREFQLPPLLVRQQDEYQREHFDICWDWSHYSVNWQMRKKIGLDVVVERLIAGEEFNGTEPILQQLHRNSVRLATHTKPILNLTIPVNKSPMWLLSQYLQQLGLKLKSRKVGPRGKQVRWFSLDPKAWEFAQKVLEYRARRREEIEEKQQRQQEQKRRYQEYLQSMWGIQPSSASDSHLSTPQQRNKGDPHSTPEQRNKGDPAGVDIGKTLGEQLAISIEVGLTSVKTFLVSLKLEERWEALANLWGEYEDEFLELMEDEEIMNLLGI